MTYFFPFYGVTGNGYDKWYLDIYWGKAHRKGSRAVQNVAIFEAQKHSTSERTAYYRTLEYYKAQVRALAELERIKKEEPL